MKVALLGAGRIGKLHAGMAARGPVEDRRMKVALLGAGRIGKLHARLLSATDGIDTLVIGDVDADRAAEVASSVGASVAPSMDAALDAADAIVIAAATGAHAELDPGVDRSGPADVLREATGREPRRDDRARRGHRRVRRPVPARLPAPLRPGLPRGPPAGPQRRPRHALCGASGRARPGAGARGVHRAVGRSLPRLLDPRLRRPALDDRLRGRGGLRRRRCPRLPGLREVRGRRHGRGDAPSHRRPARPR